MIEELWNNYKIRGWLINGSVYWKLRLRTMLAHSSGLFTNRATPCQACSFIDFDVSINDTQVSAQTTQSNLALCVCTCYHVTKQCTSHIQLGPTPGRLHTHTRYTSNMHHLGSRTARAMTDWSTDDTDIDMKSQQWVHVCSIYRMYLQPTWTLIGSDIIN